MELHILQCNTPFSYLFQVHSYGNEILLGEGPYKYRIATVICSRAIFLLSLVWHHWLCPIFYNNKAQGGFLITAIALWRESGSEYKEFFFQKESRIVPQKSYPYHLLLHHPHTHTHPIPNINFVDLVKNMEWLSSQFSNVNIYSKEKKNKIKALRKVS